MEHGSKDVSKKVEHAARELYNLTILAEGKRISDVEDKRHPDFSYITTYFQQAKNYLS